MHAHVLHNGQIQDSREALLAPGQVGFMNGWGVFSTVRVASGVLFAFERHFRRMQHDAQRLRVPFEIPFDKLERWLLSLVEANDAYDSTLRVAVVRNKGGLFEAPNLPRGYDVVAFTADLTNWKDGVRLGYMPDARFSASPFAGLKITSWAQNLVLYEQARECGLDEYILLNEAGQISECTSANIFAIQGHEVWTPPLATSGCLPGVTRALLLDEAAPRGFTVAERNLTASELESSELVFITSTTRDLLPVHAVDGVELNRDRKVFDQLLDAFLSYRRSYVGASSQHRMLARS